MACCAARSVQEPLARVRAAVDEATGATADPAVQALARAVALLAEVVGSVASPSPTSTRPPSAATGSSGRCIGRGGEDEGA